MLEDAAPGAERCYPGAFRCAGMEAAPLSSMKGDSCAAVFEEAGSSVSSFLRLFRAGLAVPARGRGRFLRQRFGGAGLPLVGFQFPGRGCIAGSASSGRAGCAKGRRRGSRGE